MIIYDKLRLSNQLFPICFFKEGSFVRVYNMSVYLALTQLNLDLKIHFVQYKKMHQQFVIKAGLPINQLLNNYPELIKYNWGYKLKGNWLVKNYNYQTWYLDKLKKLPPNIKNTHKQLALFNVD